MCNKDVSSHWTFNLSILEILRGVKFIPGFIIDGQNLNNIRNAAETVLIADTVKS